MGLGCRGVSRIVFVILSFAIYIRPLHAQFQETRASDAVLSNPLVIVPGDFNSDGLVDLAVAAFYDGKIAILLGNGDGTFKSATYYTVGGNETANSLVAVHLRDRSVLDLVVTNSQNGEVEILLGNGDGTFGLPVSYRTAGGPFSIAPGDFTNNGHMGTVALTSGANNCACLVVLPGNGDGTLGAPIATHNVGNTTALVAGKFNSGPNLDVAVANEPGISIFLGEGNGKFETGQSYFTDTPPGSIATASLRNNGILDLAVGLPFDGDIAIYLGNGDGTFTESGTVPGGFASAFTIADLNGDGRADLVAITGYPTSYITTYLGNGDGTFQAGVNYPTTGTPVFIAAADFNGDHKQDLALAAYYGNNVTTMLNTGTVSFAPTSPLNFKKQAVGTTSAAQKVTLTNTGAKSVKISSIKASAQFGMTSTCGSTVAPGAGCAVSVTFSPKSQGAKSGTVTITNSASSKPMVIELSGTGD
jgi:hypothetical protein